MRGLGELEFAGVFGQGERRRVHRRCTVVRSRWRCGAFPRSLQCTLRSLRRHSCESRNPGAAITGLGAPGFRLALRASGMTGVDFKQRILVGPAWAVRDAWSFSPP